MMMISPIIFIYMMLMLNDDDDDDDDDVDVGSGLKMDIIATVSGWIPPTTDNIWQPKQTLSPEPDATKKMWNVNFRECLERLRTRATPENEPSNPTIGDLDRWESPFPRGYFQVPAVCFWGVYPPWNSQSTILSYLGYRLFSGAMSVSFFCGSLYIGNHGVAASILERFFVEVEALLFLGTCLPHNLHTTTNI